MVVFGRTGSQPDVFEDCILCINAVIFPSEHASKMTLFYCF